MKIGDLVHFHDEHFFEGAVQLRWAQEREAQSQRAAKAFVFHGPRYHGASEAEKEGIEGNYRLKDSAGFVRDLLNSIQGGLQGEEKNPYWLAVAGYGSGKSHLALTCATLLGDPHGAAAEQIMGNIAQADEAIGRDVQNAMAQLVKPVLVLTLDGMAGFHLGNALSRSVFTQLRRYGVDDEAVRDLSPRFQTAEQFVERNFSFRAESFAQRLPGLTAAELCARLRDNDETVYTKVDDIYMEANGSPIPVAGQESAQDLINTLCDVYCGADGSFSSVVILFDEFGRYLEYAAEKPQLAGDAALQQLFQGVQDNSGKVRFIGFIQYEMKAYLKRFSSVDLRQLQRYITRFDAAEKWYLSTNLETIFAHMIGKNETELAQIWRQADAEQQWQSSWQRMKQSLPGFERLPVWNDAERFSRVIARGCWPLHPLATWLLTRQRDVVQSRSALTFIKEVIERIATEDALSAGRLRQVSAAELVLHNMLPEIIAAERETGATAAETLQLLLEKFQAHLSTEHRLLLAGIAILEKMRVGKQSQEKMDRLLCEATALSVDSLNTALRALSQELGIVEWNRDLGQYELIADASTRGQFQQWLRKRQMEITADAVRDLFVRRGVKDSDLGDIATDFGQSRQISTPEWYFEVQLAHIHSVENAIRRAFQEWWQATLPKDAKGKVIYLYLHSEDDAAAVGKKLSDYLQEELKRTGYVAAPIWIVGIVDRQGMIAEHLGRLHLFDEQISATDQERFRRFVPEERARSHQALKESVQGAIKERLYWVAGFADVPAGRLKNVGEAIFAKIYPQALPFPFDGFATAAGGGAPDCAQLTRSLIARQVDGPWVQAQPKRLQNRVQSILVRSWSALPPSGELTEPVEPTVKAVYRWLQQRHQDDPKRTLWTSYRALIAPPYGMNAASAGLLLGLLLGGAHPSRRIEQEGEMTASSDWVSAAFPVQRGRHFLEQEILKKSTLRFLSEDSEGRWRGLLNRWEAEENYQKKVALAQEAERMRKIDPLPEILEGNYKYLQNQSHQASIKLREVRSQLERWEQEIEKAERQNAVDQLLKLAPLLLQQRQEMLNGPCWPDVYVKDCETLLAQLRHFVSLRIADWIPRQSCHNVVQVGDFRRRIEKAVKSLMALGFEDEAQILEQQAQRSIFQVEKRQKFALTLAESDDYPRQPEPTESTPVRDLRDEIAKGDMLIQGIQAAESVLEAEEVRARIKAIEKRQQRLHVALHHQLDALGALYSVSFDTAESLRETLAKANRLREIFVGTRDEREVSELVIQLERILADVAAWETGEASLERLVDLLQQQIRRQLIELNAFLAEKEIEPAWLMESIYQALAASRINAARRRSADWLAPRMALAEQIGELARERCIALEQELMAAPGYLSSDDRAQVERLLDAVQRRRSELDEQARRARVTAWQQRFLALDAISRLERYETEQLLKALREPPEELLPEEQALIQPIMAQLTAHLDRMSMDEIIARIERLSTERQRQLLSLLSERLGERDEAPMVSQGR